MQLVWKPAAARGLGPAVVAQKEEGEAARFCLMPQKQDIYLLQDVRFARQLLPQERDALWQDFCALMQQRGARLLLTCRAAQSWFAQHPEHSGLLASKVKAKPGF